MPSADTLTIRRAVPVDVASLDALEKAAFAGDRLSRRSLVEHVKSDTAALLVAEDGAGVIVGYALVLFRKVTSVGRLYSLAVAQAARGSGLSGRLLEAAEIEARQRGCLFMRLEVRTDNQRAQRLYESQGYRQIGRYLDYYQDHADALRLEKPLIQEPPASPREVPFYAQTTDFTCGPAAMMMAMAGLGAPVAFGRQLEFELWREATSIYLINGPGGCDPTGIAVTLARRGFAVRVHASAAPPYFTLAQKNPKRREIMAEAQAQFVAEAEQLGIPLRFKPLRAKELADELDRGAIAIVLTSSYRMYGDRIPHWIVAYAHDRRYMFAHDPYVDPDGQDTPFGKAGVAILFDEFDRIAVFGRDRLKAAILVETQHRT